MYHEASKNPRKNLDAIIPEKLKAVVCRIETIPHEIIILDCQILGVNFLASIVNKGSKNRYG